MTRIALLFLCCVVCYSCNVPRNRTETSESVPTAKVVQTYYGTPVIEEEAIAANELEKKMIIQDTVKATVEAVVVESCQAKGCWMDVQLVDGRTMKVKFKDYAFFLPKEDLKGRTVIFTGAARRELVSVEMQRHYAEDAGKSKQEIEAITQPKEQIRFVAEGVILK